MCETEPAVSEEKTADSCCTQFSMLSMTTQSPQSKCEPCYSSTVASWKPLGEVVLLIFFIIPYAHASLKLAALMLALPFTADANTG